ncbi:T9SS type B sorting domain-containing protein [Mangrovimonas futianensis]|uniref:T9SS type B sorting domain-containing protein n=1 Tax=Mangrovimonas futianensis TaxID=2895523 RepID=UPI001E5CBB3C|nr:choice-of-anchor L domain-containing protein [Mangrovimonas futianensis]MCF1423128.1 T9SS type B sorting domain-containing protein [Mangrovimonas futianensis]
MKKCYLLMVLVGILAFSAQSQQISTNSNISIQTLVEEYLVQGCVEISNVQSNANGAPMGIDSYGYFEQASSNFPFQNGLILSTGSITSSGNVANGNTLNEGEPEWGPDSDLENALGINNTFNATSVEFDFVSVSNLVQFNYILASEEYYANYPCEYSDGFAFLIKEAGSSQPYTNIALIPGTDIPVNTSTIHEEIVGFCQAENEAYFDGYNFGDTNFNGRTVVMTASAAIQPNVQYHIKLVIADQSDENYDSAVFIQANSFNASVDLGEDITTCANSTNLNAETDNDLAVYSWFYNGQLLPSETSPQITAVNSGSYTVSISMPINNTSCEIQDTIEVILNSAQTAEGIPDYILCDSGNNNTASFDLSNMDDEVLDVVSGTNFQIAYFSSQSNAQNNSNTITAPITNTSNPQPIFVRIQDLDNGCVSYASFNLIVNDIPEINTPEEIDICDNGSADGFAEIDFAETTEAISEGNENYIVTYHTTQNEAESGANPIPLPYVNTNTSEQIFVRVEDSETGCYTTSSFIINILDAPGINTQTQTINACEQDGDGFETFDLTSVLDNVLAGLSGMIVSYHETMEDAQTGNNPIDNPESYDNTVADSQMVYICVVNPETGCASYAPINIMANALNEGSNVTNQFACDDASNDGIEDFDLEEIAESMINGMGGIIVTYYETENDQNNFENAIDQSIPYIVDDSPHTLYVTFQKDDCLYYTDLNLIVAPGVFLEPLEPVTYCDNDEDGFTSIHLSDFNGFVNQGIPNAQVRYFLTEIDAENNENQLPSNYTNTTNPFNVFVRVTNSNSKCYDVQPLEITVLAAPSINQPSDIIICDDDYDGYYQVDLESKISEIVGNDSDVSISFHTSQSNANSNTNAIINPSNFNSNTQTIYTRVESLETGCHALAIFDVIVNTQPQFPAISNYQNCESDGNQTADFYFVNKDSEILNGQIGKIAYYFESEIDALNRQNAIDKNTAYSNLSNPQTIWVRVENITDQGCFGVSSFTIEVGSLPLFNLPEDKYLCDDYTNDGSEVFDLQEVINEVSTGISDDLTITFYDSIEDAENSENELPLDYSNIQNPQQIYVKIENGSYCYGIAEFGLNVIQAPEVNMPSDFVICDIDHDGTSIFDLSVTLEEILEVRQDDLIISYHESEEDLEANINSIQDPENYENLSNPQTIYIRVTNPTTSCFVTVPVNLIVDAPPVINTFTEEICHNSTTSYYLPNAFDSLVEEPENVTFIFYTSQADAEADANPLGDTFNYTSNNSVIYVRAISSLSGCYSIGSFNLNVNPLPNANQPNDLVSCDDDSDGMLVFDLSQQNNTILGNQGSEDFTITYYEILQEAAAGDNPISNLNYLAFDGQTIFARVTNNLTGCFSITSFNCIVNRIPLVDIPDQTICLNSEEPLVVSAFTGYNNDSYLWSTNQIGPEIQINQIGEYSVTVTTENGCSTTTTFQVMESEQASIDFTETIDFSNPSNITVTISGIGNYLYTLDGGTPQESNVFYHVSWGLHTIEIIDLNGCASAFKEIMVINAPTFFTPNNDGDNDLWQIAGIEQLEGTMVYIFDRYGKLLQTMNSSSKGWDGTYNGHNMPSDDYWFLAQVKKGEKQFEVRNHFTLKR